MGKNKILVLGSNGFSGRHFVNYLISKQKSKFELICADKIVHKNSNAVFVPVDLTVKTALKKLICSCKPDYIVNFAGILKHESFDCLLSVNAGITRNIFDIILENNIKLKKMLIIGSAAEYGINTDLPLKENSRLDPVSMYGLSKSIQSLMARYYYINNNIPVVVARTFNIIGEDISTLLSIGSFAEQINSAKNNSLIKVGNLMSKRDFLDITDVIDAYWRLLMVGKAGQVYNVCRGKSVSMNSILNSMISLSGKNIEVKKSDLLFRNNDISDIYGSNKLLISETGWQIKISVNNALKKIIHAKKN